MTETTKKRRVLAEDHYSFLAIHPGEMLQDELDARDISVDQFADIINCNRQDFRNIIDGKSPITAEIAMKIEAATDIKAYIWIGLQKDYDYQTAQKDPKLIQMLKQIRLSAASVLL